MDKKDEFKEFIKSKPELVDLVKNKKYTWQDFYEVYDLYGNNDDVWNKYWLLCSSFGAPFLFAFFAGSIVLLLILISS